MKETAKGPSEKTVRTLLNKYRCHVPFHVVRARFMGNIATPALSAAPLRVVKGLWGGELPVFEDVDEANSLIGALVQGLWNDLTRHQRRSQPFRLTRLPMEPTAASIGHFSRVRLEELDGFLEGLFDGEDAVDLPERAHRAVGYLCELRALVAGICELMAREGDVGDRAQLGIFCKQLRQLTRIMEAEINETVLSCTRARRQALTGILTDNPTIH